MRKSLALAVSLLGLFDSAYLWWVYTSPSRPMVCLGTGCDVVRASPYATLWGYPVPIYGAGMYTLLALLIFADALVSGRLQLGVRSLVAEISGAGFLASLYLTGIEAFVLHAWCAWCVVSALAITFIFVVAMLELIRPAPQPEPSVALARVRTHFLVFAGAIVLGAPAFFLLARSGALPSVSPEQASPEVLREHLVRAESHVAGNSAAPVTVVEFADLQCPVCGAAERTARDIRRKYGSQMRFVYRHFPLEHIHAWAEKAAEATECAGDQGKFWEAVENFYEHQNDLSVPALKRYAAEIGLDESRFSQCLSSGSMAARVRRDVADGDALGIRATPTFFVGQQRLLGSPEFAKFAGLIDLEIAAQGGAVTPSGAISQGSTAPRPPQAVSPNGATRPSRDPSSPGPALLGNSGNGIFSQFQNSATACSEEEARQQQPTLIGTPQARQYFQDASKALFVDVRAPQEFRAERIPGAINVPAEEIGQRWSALPKNRTLVFYESGRAPGDICASSRGAGRLLLAYGFSREQVKVYQDGLAGWEKANLPIEH